MSEIIIFVAGLIIGVVLMCIIKKIVTGRVCKRARPLEYPADFPNAKMTDADSLSDEDRDALFKHHI